MASRKQERMEEAHDRLIKIPKTTTLKDIKKMISVNPFKIEWRIDPIQQYTMQLKMQKLPVFAQAVNRNMSNLYYNFLNYKVDMKENIAIEIKGVTRCLSEDTKIKVMNNKNIENISLKKLEEKSKLITFNLKKNITEIKGAKKIDSGIQQIYRIKTESGRTTDATSEHRFFILYNDKIYIKKLKDIRLGDKLVIIR